MSRVLGVEYMEWAKQVPHTAKYAVALSGVSAPAPEEFGFDPSQLRLEGSNKYGDEELRSAIAAREGLTARECLLAEGTSMVNAILASLLLESGDIALCEVPGYEPLVRASELFGATVRPLPRRFEDGFRPDHDALVRELQAGAKVVWMTNLHNPSATLLPHAEFGRIHAAVEAAGAWLIVDEVYREFVPGVPSAVTLGPRAIVTSSLTKVQGLGGIRMGWALGPAEVMERARVQQGVFSAETSYPSVCVAKAALAHMDALVRRGRDIAARGRAIYEPWLAAHPELREVRPAGGIISFPRLPEGMEDRRLVDRLRTRHECAAVPGYYFGAPGHLRIGYGGSPEILHEGLRRLGLALKEELEGVQA